MIECAGGGGGEWRGRGVDDIQLPSRLLGVDWQSVVSS